MKPTSQQESAVNADGHCCIVACPGSGKTRTLVMKSERIIRTNAQAKILIVTFTNDAAEEITERIHGSIPGAKDKVHAGTFHALSNRLLKRAKLHSRLINDGERKQLIYQACEHTGWEIDMDTAIQEIDYYKSRMTHGASNSPGYRVYLEYQNLLESTGCMDYGDMLIRAVEGMKSGKIKPYQATHMMVDEYQDTDEVQAAFVKSHIDAGCIVTIVGDDDQTIYSWRHAMGYRGMMNFVNTHQAKLITITTNFRSHEEILVPAIQLIRQNTERVDKAIESSKGFGGKVLCYEFTERNEEMRALVETVQNNPSEWAVLARTNYALQEVEANLNAYGIPYTISKSSSLWSKADIHIYIGLLKTVINKKQDVGFINALSWMGVPKDYINHLREECGGNLHQITEINAIKDHKSQMIQYLQSHLDSWRESFAEDNTCYHEMAIGAIGEWMIQNRVRNKPKDNNEDMINIAVRVIRNLKGSIRTRLRVVEQMEQESEQEHDEPGVRLMTLHGSKGLEFRNVWMPMFEESVLPLNTEESDISEERRLAYVGMTRAKNLLITSYSTQFWSRGGISQRTPSRFLFEAGLPVVNMDCIYDYENS